MLSNGSTEARLAGSKIGKPEHCWPTPAVKGRPYRPVNCTGPRYEPGTVSVDKTPIRLHHENHLVAPGGQRVEFKGVGVSQGARSAGTEHLGEMGQDLVVQHIGFPT